LSFKIVGNEVVDQKKCRWIEGTFIYTEGGTKPRPVILKILVNEAALKALFAGKLGELEPQQRRPIKVWIKVEDNSPKRLEETRGPNDFPLLAGLMQDVSGALPLAPLPGEIKDSRGEIKSKTIEYQKGQLVCKGFRTRSIEKCDGGKFQTHTTRSVWVTDVEPLGFVECQISRKRLVAEKIDFTVKMNVSLANFGENSKSALPDHN